VKLPDFVIHLRDSDADRYARISFEAEVGGEKDKTDLTARLAVVRDVFIAYLSDRTLEELRGSEGLAQTKAALLKKLASAAPGVRVVGLYVTDLVMQ
jgi:flagellar FliL protein